jgi:hypothetical protein
VSGGRLAPVIRLAVFYQPQRGVPDHRVMLVILLPSELLRRVSAHFRRRQDDLPAAGQRINPGGTSTFQHLDVQERLGDRGPADEQTVVAQDHRFMLPQAGDQTLPLVQIQRDPS